MKLDKVNDKIKNAIQTIANNFTPFSEECFNDIEQSVSYLEAKTNEIIVKEGQYSDKIYFVIEGAARTYYLKQDDGKEITDLFVFEGNFISSIKSFFYKIPSPDYLQFLQNSNAISISREAIENLCKKHHDFERLFRIVVTNEMLRLQQRIVSIQFETAQQKYESLILKYPNIENQVQLGQIASFLGITQETLSRLRANRSRI